MACQQRTLSSVSSQAVPTISADAVKISCTSNSLSEGEEAAGEQTVQVCGGLQTPSGLQSHRVSALHRQQRSHQSLKRGVRLVME